MAMFCTICEVMLILPKDEVIIPLFTRLPVDRFMLFMACMSGIAPVLLALMMEPPAVKLRLPALDMVPALTMLCRALRLRSRLLTALESPAVDGRIVEMRACSLLIMLAALIMALVTCGFDDSA